MTQNINSFGKKLRACGNTKGLSQTELAKLLDTNHSIIGKYERYHVKPTIDLVKRLVDELETIVSFKLGESIPVNLLKNLAMLKRHNDIDTLQIDDKKCMLYTIDGLIRDAKTRLVYI